VKFVMKAHNYLDFIIVNAKKFVNLALNQHSWSQKSIIILLCHVYPVMNKSSLKIFIIYLKTGVNWINFFRREFKKVSTL
jgi:hypothetical protein